MVEGIQIGERRIVKVAIPFTAREAISALHASTLQGSLYANQTDTYSKAQGALNGKNVTNISLAYFNSLGASRAETAMAKELNEFDELRADTHLLKEPLKDSFPADSEDSREHSNMPLTEDELEAVDGEEYNVDVFLEVVCTDIRRRIPPVLDGQSLRHHSMSCSFYEPFPSHLAYENAKNSLSVSQKSETATVVMVVVLSRVR